MKKQCQCWFLLFVIVQLGSCNSNIRVNEKKDRSVPNAASDGVDEEASDDPEAPTDLGSDSDTSDKNVIEITVNPLPNPMLSINAGRWERPISAI